MKYLYFWSALFLLTFFYIIRPTQREAMLQDGIRRGLFDSAAQFHFCLFVFALLPIANTYFCMRILFSIARKLFILVVLVNCACAPLIWSAPRSFIADAKVTIIGLDTLRRVEHVQVIADISVMGDRMAFECKSPSLTVSIGAMHRINPDTYAGQDQQGKKYEITFGGHREPYLVLIREENCQTIIGHQFYNP